MSNSSTSRNKKNVQTASPAKSAGAMKQGGRMLANTPQYDQNFISEHNFLLNRLGALDINALSPEVRQQLNALAGNYEFMAILEETNPKLAYQILEDAPQFRPENFTANLLNR